MTEFFGSKLCYDIFISSYLKPLSSQNNESKNCKLGHAKEKTLVNNLFRDYKRILQEMGLDILDLHDAGIVKNKKITYAKTMIDFLGCASGKMKLFFLGEYKSRCNARIKYL